MRVCTHFYKFLRGSGQREHLPANPHQKPKSEWRIFDTFILPSLLLLKGLRSTALLATQFIRTCIGQGGQQL
jgi:hypothetical protein